jgi:hypothetical protein
MTMPKSAKVMSALRIGLLAGACLFAAAAQAEVPVNGSTYADAAVEAVESLMRVERKTGLPRLSDKVDGKVLEDAWNEPAILGAPPYGANDIQPLLNIVQKEARILQAYTLYSPNPGRTPPDLARNAAEYQDEISRSQAFLIRAVAASLEAIADFMAQIPAEAKTDARLQGVRQMRLGLQEIVNGMALGLRSPALKESNQVLLAQALADSSQRLVAGLAPADRTALAATLKAAQPALKPAAQKPIADVITAASSASCEGLCALK